MIIINSITLERLFESWLTFEVIIIYANLKKCFLDKKVFISDRDIVESFSNGNYSKPFIQIIEAI